MELGGVSQEFQLDLKEWRGYLRGSHDRTEEFRSLSGLFIVPQEHLSGFKGISWSFVEWQGLFREFQEDSEGLQRISVELKGACLMEWVFKGILETLQVI